VAANPFAEMTAYGMLAAVAARHGSREAIVFGDERITFADFGARVDAFAAGLAALGLGPGDALAIWLPNRPLWFVAQYAAARLGVVIVALNPRYRAHELAYILTQSNATALLLTDHLGPIDYFETLHEVIPDLSNAEPGALTSTNLPKLRHVIVDADDPYPGCLRASDLYSPDDAAAGGLAGVGGGEASRANASLSEEASPPSGAGDTTWADRVDVPATLARVYTECARIWNPIHTDVAVARAAGLAAPILHGTATLALAISRAVEHHADGEASSVREVSARFTGMVAMPSTLTVRGRGRAGDGIGFDVVNEAGAPVLTAGTLRFRPRG